MTTVSPKENLYLAINGEWLAQAVIPDDKSSVGGFQELADGVEALLMNDLAKMANGEMTTTSPLQNEMVKYYRLAEDTQAREVLGMAPVKPLLKQIEAIQSVEDLMKWVVQANLKGLPAPFYVNVYIDFADSTRHTVYVSGPSLFLPEKSYYDEGHTAGQALQAKFAELVPYFLQEAGYSSDRAQAIFTEAIAFDRQVVPYTKSAEEQADYVANYNPRTLSELESYLEWTSLTQLVTEVLGATPDAVSIDSPRLFEQFNTLFHEQQLERLKAWLLVKTLWAAVPILSETYRAKVHEYSQIISGNPVMRPAAKRAYDYVSSRYEQVLGVYYGERYFGEQAKADVRHMVEEMVGIYQERLATKEWLSEQTRALAIRKLNTMEILVGYPDRIPSYYEQLIVGEDDFFSCSLRFNEIEKRDALDKWNQPVDRTRWGMGAHVVNAYFHPMSNLICFPAAILQAPFYSLQQSASANYGGIGAVIAHEISHAFDNNGAKFDEFGNLNNWWTEEDFAAFDQLAEKMIQLWDGLPSGNGKVNGKLTVSENIADAGGLSCALTAVERLEVPEYKEFFDNWARIWCRKMRPELADYYLAVDVHSPAELRANMTPKHLSRFYEVYDIQPSDAMYLAPEQRIEIW